MKFPFFIILIRKYCFFFSIDKNYRYVVETFSYFKCITAFFDKTFEFMLLFIRHTLLNEFLLFEMKEW